METIKNPESGSTKEQGAPSVTPVQRVTSYGYTISSILPQYIVQLCCYCKHDCGMRYKCPNCQKSHNLWYIRESGSKLFCNGCKTVFPGPILDLCDHSGQTDYEIPEDHECGYVIRSNTTIEEINPITKRLNKRYVLAQEQEILPNNILTDFAYNRDHLTLCRQCRFIPDIDFSDRPAVIEYLRQETKYDKAIQEYYDRFPDLKLILPSDNRYSDSPIKWLDKLRVYAYREIRRRVDRLNYPIHSGAAVEAEKRVFQEIMAKCS